MTGRVLLNTSGLKVSKPGYNVETATAGQLQFSSDWGQLGRFGVGDIDCNWNESAFRFYAFAKSFPSPPIVFLSRVDGASIVNYGPVGYVFFSYTDNVGTSPVRYNYVEVSAQVTATGLLIRSVRQNDSGGSRPIPSFVLRYTVMDYYL